jgi:hypothetical protein
MRSEHWQQRHGITASQAYWKVEEAVRVVSGCGKLYPVLGLMNGAHFRDAFRDIRYVRYEPQPGLYKTHPDFIAFQGFVQGVLEYIADKHPSAEKVDFVVERKTGVSHYSADHLIDEIKRALAEHGYESLVRYIGEVIPAGKSRVPLQAADVML